MPEFPGRAIQILADSNMSERERAEKKHEKLRDLESCQKSNLNLHFKGYRIYDYVGQVKVQYNKEFPVSPATPSLWYICVDRIFIGRN